MAGDGLEAQLLDNYRQVVTSAYDMNLRVRIVQDAPKPVPPRKNEQYAAAGLASAVSASPAQSYVVKQGGLGIAVEPARLEGREEVPIVAGIAAWPDLRLFAKPGSQIWLAVNHEESEMEVALVVNVRRCRRGEEELMQECAKCPPGSVSTQAGRPCQPCVRGSICPGGDQITALAGFYIVSKQPLKVEACPDPNVCLGGEDSSCAPGYVGALCQQCTEGRSRCLSGACVDGVCIEVQVGLVLVCVVAVVGMTVQQFYSKKYQVELIKALKKHNKKGRRYRRKKDDDEDDSGDEVALMIPGADGHDAASVVIDGAPDTHTHTRPGSFRDDSDRGRDQDASVREQPTLVDDADSHSDGGAARAFRKPSRGKEAGGKKERRKRVRLLGGDDTASAVASRQRGNGECELEMVELALGARDAGNAGWGGGQVEPLGTEEDVAAGGRSPGMRHSPGSPDRGRGVTRGGARRARGRRGGGSTGAGQSSSGEEANFEGALLSFEGGIACVRACVLPLSPVIAAWQPHTWALLCRDRAVVSL